MSKDLTVAMRDYIELGKKVRQFQACDLVRSLAAL